MISTPFNDGWTCAPQVQIFRKLGAPDESRPVTLPHDALITTERRPEHGVDSAFFPSAAFQYVKKFGVPEEWQGKHVSLHFDGVYRDAMVFVNDGLAANRPYGYSPFRVDLAPYLRYGTTNTVRVEVRTHADSRWYAGAGIYRDVRLEVRNPVHIRVAELHATTPEIDDALAVVEVSFPVDNIANETRTLDARVTLRDPEGEVAAARTEPVTVLARSSATVRMRVYVDAPRRWSVDDPNLYSLAVELLDSGAEVDAASLRVGLRTLSIDPRRGLRINGEQIKLRGACIHHDNGPLGAAAFVDAERRRIAMLKAAGFNAVRSAHNPMSQAMLDACDELGVIVMDEAFDMWTEQKTPFDYSVDFSQWWERDIEAMVLRDRNHPSVVLYSIGNEIPETGNPFGADLGRKLAEKVRSLDPDRIITNGISGFVSVIDDVVAMMASGQIGAGRGADAAESPNGGPGAGGVNDAASADVNGMNQLNRSELVTRKTAEAHAVVDVAGLNYADARYELDAQERPDRIIVGTETYPNRIANNWALVSKYPHVIGDFTWTGWDYLGEVSLGRPKYDSDDLQSKPEYPWLTAWCGDIDITGFRRPASYYREIVFGLRAEPYIAVRNPESFGRKQFEGAWAWSDSQGSWTWDVPAGTPLTVEVYSADEEVELVINGSSLGRKPAGPEHGFRALFDTHYAPGEVAAIGWSGGQQGGVFRLASQVGDARLAVSPEQETIPLHPGALVFVPIEVVDANGTLLTTSNVSVEVAVTGPAVLQGLGSGRPENPEPFHATSHRAFRGRLLAILRPTGIGAVGLTASADGLGTVETRVEIVEITD